MHRIPAWIARRAAKNFYPAFLILPRARRRAMYALYAFNRQTDDIADSAGDMPTKTVVVKDYDGKLLNGPNDVWVRPDGGAYFTDPYYKRPYWTRGPKEQDVEAVYYLAPDGILTRVDGNLKQPMMPFGCFRSAATRVRVLASGVR